VSKNEETPSTSLSYDNLKAKHRAIREGFPNSLSLRVHRALSWLQRAEMEEEDSNAAFVFYWISFNAAYADELNDALFENERSAFANFFQKMTALDTDNRLYNVIWEKFTQAIRVLLRNKYVYQPFWKYHNGDQSYKDWESRFDRSKKRISVALNKQDTETILSTLFDRLYVLRNQIVHGGSTWNGAVNREQVRDGAVILGFLVPLFIDLMMDNPEVEWGEPYYPVVD